MDFRSDMDAYSFDVHDHDGVCHGTPERSRKLTAGEVNQLVTFIWSISSMEVVQAVEEEVGKGHHLDVFRDRRQLWEELKTSDTLSNICESYV